MLIKKIEDCCAFAFAAIDGAYGWLAETVALVIFVIIFNFFSKWALKRLHESFCGQNKIWQDSFVKALHTPLSVYVWFFTFVHILDLISYHTIAKVTFEHMHLTLALGAVGCLSWFLLRWKKNVVEHVSILSKNHLLALDQTKIDVMDKLATVFILFLALLMLMEISDRSMKTIIAFGGVGGLAIAFASQEMISNFFGGIMIYATHPFSKGETIYIPDKKIEGTVEEIGWYMTRVRSTDKRPIYVPNSIFTKVVVITPSRMTHRQFKEIIGLRYEDMPALKNIISEIKQILKKNPALDQDYPLLVNFDSFGNYSLDISVEAYSSVLDAEGFNKVKSDILFNIADILNKHQAEMAYPVTSVFIPEKIPLTPS